MLPQILFIVGFLVALWLVADWFARTRPGTAARAMRWLGLGGLVVLGAWLVLTGKLAGLFAVAAGLAPWIIRAMRLHGLWRMLRQLGIRMGGGQAQGGGTSRVATRFLAMELDHDSGRLDGEVLEGKWRGRRLSSLSLDEAMELWRHIQADADSVQVFESWADRTWPDWRDTAGVGNAAEPPPPGSAMTPEEARDILGVGPGAGDDEIKAAHRRLMLANHPDHGGSTWIASRINQARDVLLGG
ncbi:molecular chaperone DnaJ [Magnetospirillum sp. UT-4]|uniref:molecular chaperone DnaJ n=1 Tax=Magnetospirillum sp. UT-4 TaxID=2681467 RepID=UPI001380E87F|nr:molecular chaperone DnaJ [Magnetospirillum sp. UT-4]CAA7626941.1 Heat shock protein DnaJ [Magnetospirillum sp. UT-4]